GLDAALGIQLFLDRLDALESSPKRANTRQDDAKALALLAKRGIDADERMRLRKLIQVATTLPELPDEGTLTKMANARKERHKLILEALHLWWKDWSTVARSHLKRQHLIWLGLAKRSNSKSNGDPRR
ncbi:MAG: hypothetical protein AAFS10_15165, partial [Myxococcota bacterium]